MQSGDVTHFPVLRMNDEKIFFALQRRNDNYCTKSL